jgi:hypothetical protein
MTLRFLHGNSTNGLARLEKSSCSKKARVIAHRFSLARSGCNTFFDGVGIVLDGGVASSKNIVAHRLYVGLTNAVARCSSFGAAVRRVRHILDVFGMVLDGGVA